ncbi:PilZ domain-containing protein [Thalassomonas viridans]|uniref:PilZ domain-containing protein n=1 Tax=Thalassomonas viridans TaxID=137584 RepID=A0AAF0CB74_9GAMM|nr:PilZ domain-containing protein [Thalassomonas viridans]WDE07633.1 PilZ domain-containing protein [Thalassomonas viridans]
MAKISLEFVNDKELYLAYMPFLKAGGLFVRTTEAYELGADISLDVALPDSLESSEVKGKVCWITPVGAQNGTPPGIGISFIEDPDNLRSQIEKVLGRHLNSSEPTLTM